jgi:hypothetical protein
VSTRHKGDAGSDILAIAEDRSVVRRGGEGRGRGLNNSTGAQSGGCKNSITEIYFERFLAVWQDSKALPPARLLIVFFAGLALIWTRRRSIVRRDTGESYEEFLRGLAKASGIETPTREDLVRLDRKRKKRTSNQEWKSPADENTRIAKTKDGRTHLRGRDNILKRQLVHVGAFNLSLILRQLLGAGTPRELRNHSGQLVLSLLLLLWYGNGQQRCRSSRISASTVQHVAKSHTRLRRPLCRKSAPSTTDC